MWWFVLLLMLILPASWWKPQEEQAAMRVTVRDIHATTDSAATAADDADRVRLHPQAEKEPGLSRAD